MALIKYTDVARNTRGDSLPDYRLQVVTSAGAGVDIYSDGAGTRFRDGSGNVVNYATANPSGKVEFYWTPAAGQVLQVLDTSGTLVDTDADFADKFVLGNLVGEVPQSQVTDLPTDLAAKASSADLASTDSGKGAALINTVDGFTVQQEIDFANGLIYYAEKFGVVADGVTDNTSAVEAALTAVQATGGTLIFPRGTILIGEIENWAARSVTIAGAGMSETVLKFTNAGVAFNADAFPIPAGEPGSGSQPFIDQFNVRELTIEGNVGTTSIARLQGIARSHWELVNLREAGVSNAKGFHFFGVVTCKFTSCYVSNNYNSMTYKPFWGLYAEAGSRNGQSIGNTSEPVLINCEFNGLPIGMELFQCDQMLMMGGAAQNCTNTGMVVRPSCRYNTFENVAFENTSASAFDVQDQGVLTKYKNCYSVKEFRIQGTQIELDGSYHERVQIDSQAVRTRVRGIRFNNWTTGNGGFSNASSSTYAVSLYDMDAGAFIANIGDGDVPSGSAFPASPISGQRFRRTDRNIQYYYDGTRWLSEQLFSQGIGSFNTVSATTNNYVAPPFKGLYDIYLVGFTGSSFKDAVARWDLILNGRATNGAVTKIAERVGTSDTVGDYVSSYVAINAVLDSSYPFLLMQYNKISGASNAIGAATLYFRLIG